MVKFEEYGTWIPPKISDAEIVAVAYRDGITISVPDLVQGKRDAYGKQIIYYGTAYLKVIEVSRDKGVTWNAIKGDTFYFDREIDGYPERKDIRENYLIKAYYRNEEAGKDGEKSEIVYPNVENYGTWKLEPPIITKRISDRTISLLFVQPPRADESIIQYGTTQYKVSVRKYEHKQSDINIYKKAVGDDGTLYSDKACTVEYQIPDAPLYAVPTNQYVKNDSGVLLIVYEEQKNIFLNNDNGKYYVSTKADAEEYDLETAPEGEEYIYHSEEGKFKKYICVESTDTEWYHPAVTLNPYDKEENYKEEADTDYVISDNTYMQTMPLSGQSTNNMYDTMYGFRVIAFNETGAVTEPVYINATATCTSIRDIVKANADYKQLYVESLSAISANIGVITEGAFGDFKKNHIAMSKVQDEYGNTFYPGQTRLGGNNQYFIIKPRLNADGGVIVDSNNEIQYDIMIKAGNISLESGSIGTGGGTYVYDSSNNPKAEGEEKYRLALLSTGITIEMTTDTYDVENPGTAHWYSRSKVSIDRFKSLIITNDVEIEPDRAVNISDNSVKIYHFDKDFNDENGEDSEDLKLTSIGRSDISFIQGKISGSADGLIESTVKHKTCQMIVVNKSDHVTFGDTEFYSPTDIRPTFNKLAKTEWGLTDAQIKSRIFKIKK